MLTEKRLKMRQTLLFSGGSQILFILVFTVIGAAQWHWWGGCGGFILSFIYQGALTGTMWLRSNLTRQMFSAGIPLGRRPIDWLLIWPVVVWRQLKFVTTDAYTPDS